MERLNQIIDRCEDKKRDYRRYNFSRHQDEALKCLFDLAQEYIYTDDHYRLCVAIPMIFFGYESAIYVLEDDRQLHLKCDTKQGLIEDGPAVSSLPVTTDRYVRDNQLILPIRGHGELKNVLPFATEEMLLGMMTVGPADLLDEDEDFFFEKYANRVGYSLHHKIIARKNVEHIEFIRSLVQDIGHNVIVPNMIFKAFLRRLAGKITMNLELESRLAARLADDNVEKLSLERVERYYRELKAVNEGLQEELGNLTRHYEHTSLFLETLLRRSHFERGGYVLEKRPCNFYSQILAPQLARFEERLRERGIEIDHELSGVPDAEIEVVVDVGLISQVYANLFSNAVKYTRAVTGSDGRRVKYLSYGMEPCADCLGPGKDGIKFNVFTTGPHLSPEDAALVFEEGVRGGNIEQEPGTGHGLRFIKDVVKLHGGLVGYEPTADGNNFYFILPRQ